MAHGRCWRWPASTAIPLSSSRHVRRGALALLAACKTLGIRTQHLQASGIACESPQNQHRCVRNVPRKMRLLASSLSDDRAQAATHAKSCAAPQRQHYGAGPTGARRGVWGCRDGPDDGAGPGRGRKGPPQKNQDVKLRTRGPSVRFDVPEGLVRHSENDRRRHRARAASSFGR